MVIIHGEHLVQSRQYLVKMLQAARSVGREVIQLEAARLLPAELEQVLGSSSLFATPKTIVIEELHSLPTSAKKTELIQQLAQASQSENEAQQLILWEKRALTPTMLKPYPGAQVILSKVNNAVFSWLESLDPHPQTKAAQLKLLKTAVKSEDAFMCLAMLIRQVRMLIQLKGGVKVGGSPFMVSKLSSQANRFSLDQLLATHRKLLQLDLSLKTSSSGLTAEHQLDLLVIDL